MRKLLCILLLLILSFTVCGSSRVLRRETFGQRYGIDPTGLVLWLDQSDPRSYGDVGNWYDLSGQGNHGTQAVGANQPAITGAVGLAGSCRDFDGGTDYVGAGTMGDFGSGLGGSPTTFIGWVLSTDAVTVMNVFGTINDDLTTLLQLAVNDNAGGWIFAHIRDEDIQVYNGRVEFDTGITDGSWHNIAVVWDCYTAAREISVYLDGVKLVFTSGSNDQADNTANFEYPLAIGARNTRGVIEKNLDGLLSNIVFFNRELAAAEIQRMYLVDKPRYGG